MDLRTRIQEEIDKIDGMTVRSLSIKAGLSDSALHKFMTGATKSLTTDNLEKIAGALGMTALQLWRGGGPNVEYIWDHIPKRRQAQALQVLRTFAEMGDDEAEM